MFTVFHDEIKQVSLYSHRIDNISLKVHVAKLGVRYMRALNH